MKSTLIIPVAVLSLLPLAALAVPSACGELKNAYGPFDYRTHKSELVIVEDVHFTPDVEALRRSTTATVAGDIDYTLRASPNHHRALMALVNLALRDHTEKPNGPRSYTVDCYFDRAYRFASDDGVVRIIHGIWLYRVGKKKESVIALEEARRYEEDNPNLHYNLGLVYFDLRDMPRALESAQKAYKLGAQLPGLRNKLKAAGVWKEPVGAQPSASAEPPSASTGAPGK